ncbi:MAG TPA: PHB depolymerase family esterase [Pyrinomonadaceae bacterium]|jgi:polyhydroxybutyrate depolymerase|nr:PHB depolymerase family esterase [Pyrinomonadaceae bacterium]
MKIFGILLALATVAISAQSGVAQTTMSWTIDGVKREAIVFAPKPVAATNAVSHPLVFGFHGHGGTMQGAAQSMHIQTLWPQAIVVYPQGLNTKAKVDPNGDKPGWQNQAGNDGDRDLKLFDAMLLTMHQKFTVDDERVYTTGFSAGGVFSYLLWAERGKTIAAVGEVAGRLFDPEHLTETRALLAIAGQLDTTDPYAMQQQTVETAKQVDNATGAGQSCGPNCKFYPSTTQTPVKTFFHPGAHIYPPWAPAEIVKFFQNHKRP